MKNLTLIALAFVLVGSSDATPAARQLSDGIVCDGGDAISCRHIIQATRELTGMLTTSNPAPLRRHLDPRALWVSTTGVVRSGQELIQFISRDSPRATARLDGASVRFFGDVAIVTWSESWTAPGAAVPAGRLAGVDTWAKRRGRWRIIAIAESRVAL